MKSGFKKTAQYILFFAIGILLVWFAFKGISFTELVSILKEANYWWLIVAIAASIIAFFIRAKRWTLLMEPMGFTPSLINTYHSLLTGYLANLALPRLGEITRCAALGKKENIPFDKLVGTVIIERTIDFITVLVLMVFLLIWGSAATGNFISENIIKPIGTKLSSLFDFSIVTYSIIIVFLALLVWLTIRYRSRLAGRPLIKKVLGFLKGIADGLKTIASLKRKWEFLLLTVLMWGFYLLLSWMPLYCLASTEHLGAGAALFILIIGSLGMAVPVQSGMGAYHLIVWYGLNIVYGISKEQGLAYATISHESQILLIAVLGAISMFALFGRKGARALKAEQKNAG